MYHCPLPYDQLLILIPTHLGIIKWNSLSGRLSHQYDWSLPITSIGCTVANMLSAMNVDLTVLTKPCMGGFPYSTPMSNQFVMESINGISKHVCITIKSFYLNGCSLGAMLSGTAHRPEMVSNYQCATPYGEGTGAVK